MHIHFLEKVLSENVKTQLMEIVDGKGVSPEYVRNFYNEFVFDFTCETPNVLKPSSLFRSICLEHISSGV